MDFLVVDHVTKNFPAASGSGQTCVFRDVAFTIAEGEFLTMVGHSGCGKSTLLNIIAGLEKSTAGGVVLSGREIAEPGMDRMVVFQNFSLMPWMTVFENIRLAVRAAFPGWSRTQVNACVQRWITTVGLGGSESKRPAALSGGMRQRVGLARAFSTVKLARPRRRSELIDDPEYLRLRTHILRFLVEGSGQGGSHG